MGVLQVVTGLLLLCYRTSPFVMRSSPSRAATACAAAVEGGGVETPKRKIFLMVEPTPFTHVSGYANRFKEMLRHLESRGDAVVVATPDDTPEAPDSWGAFPVVTLGGFRFRPWYPDICLSIDYKGKALETLEAFDPDVIHCSSPGFLAVVATQYARQLGKPLLLSYHTHIPVYVKRYASWVPFVERATWKLIKTIHNRADFTITTSPQLRDELLAQGIERVGVWTKGIDTRRFDPSFKSDAARAELTDGHPDAPLAIYVGRLGVEKRIDELRGVLERIPELRLALVGSGPAREDLEAHFGGDLRDRVHFAGTLSGDALSAAFASADVFCMPSDSETLGFVVLESMASGVPVVGCNAGGVPNLIDDGVDGYLHETGDVDAMADRVRRLIQDPARRKAMGAAARAEAEKWDWASSGEALRSEAYATAIANFEENRGKDAY